MARRRTWTDEQLIEAVKASKSIFGVFRHLGRRIGGGAHYEMKRHISRLGIDTSHFTGQRWNTGMRGGKRKDRVPLDVILVKDSTFTNTARLKGRVLEAGLLKNECSECHLPPTWNGRPLVLRIDHINGDRGDHRLENLRILCPNCDAQTSTFAGRNKRRKS
jgi:5-methylcytosine-specific restriction endonuclease McrA